MALILAAAGAAAVWYYLKPHPEMENKKLNTDPNLPRGYRNNNPLNIRYSAANAWKGKILPNTDGAFEQFSSMTYGYRAAMYLIRKYISQGYDTVGAIISKWAPANENNTAGYIDRVCKDTGFYPTKVIDRNSYAEISALVAAMARVENGNTPSPDYSDILAGWQLL